METAEKEYSKIQWFLFVVLIPGLFTLFLVIVLLSIAGVNTLGMVKDYSEKIPFISSLIPDKGSTEKLSEDASIDNQRIDKLKEDNSTKQAEIEKLTNEINSKQTEIDSLQQEVGRLTSELAELKDTGDSRSKSIEELKKMYETMSAKNAALIIPNLKSDSAKQILRALDTEKLAAILEKMSPEDAARFTELISQN